MRKYVALLGQGPAWDHSKSRHEQDSKAMEGHFAAMRGLYDSGELHLGGMFEAAGGMAVLAVPDEAAARALMDADPGVAAGLLDYELRAFEAVFDLAEDLRTEGTAVELGERHAANPEFAQ